jgi:hypothetical protein
MARLMARHIANGTALRHGTRDRRPPGAGTEEAFRHILGLYLLRLQQAAADDTPRPALCRARVARSQNHGHELPAEWELVVMRRCLHGVG